MVCATQELAAPAKTQRSGALDTRDRAGRRLGISFIDCANSYGRAQSETIGLLSGRFRRGEAPPPDAPSDTERLREALSVRGWQAIETLLEVAKERGVTPAQMAIAWILDHPEVTAPIVGADRPEYVDDVFGALEIRLTPEERQRLDQMSQWDIPGRYV
jgi:aryl-alcohol dehydrogenase-like predicted oxidoreductase